jgi:hypothetical protein
MARCPDCNKFVSYGDIETEIENEEISDTTLSANVTVYLTCGDCGTQLRQACLDFEEEIDHECTEEAIAAATAKRGKPFDADVDDQFEITNSNAEGCDRAETKDRNGKVIKSSRYMKTYYGADLEFTVKCHKCDAEETVNGNVEEQASGFDEV